MNFLQNGIFFDLVCWFPCPLLRALPGADALQAGGWRAILLIVFYAFRVKSGPVPLFAFSGEVNEVAKSGIAKLTQDLCEPVIEELGFELVDVEYKKENSSWFLRLFVDKRGGIGLEDCATISQRIDPLIDEKIEVPHAYYLEVSSPGLDRPLVTDRDFLRHVDDLVEVTLYQARDGKKRYQGRILGCEEGVLLLAAEDGTELRFTPEERAKVKQVIVFE